ncbi:MAG: NUDIX domain-containing protein [Patescibacteria group bacterium]|nr:NUDIX domain-containing protein [Patescibacteria group bacterium]
MLKKFKFCPNCQNKLKKVKKRLVECSNCGFHFYFNPVPTCALILENEKEEILLVKRKYPPKKGFWDLPGGFIDFKETVEGGLKREIKEELAIEIEKINYFGNYIGFYSYKGINYQPLCFFYTAKIKDDQIKKIKTGDDANKFKFFPKNKIPWKRLSFIDIKAALKDYVKIV